ncbi:ribonuclease P protein component [Chitinispirillum alkaliphilum]|nr:ribonuclease P protein component [Chitinispirillum alkaliphilum]
MLKREIIFLIDISHFWCQGRCLSLETQSYNLFLRLKKKSDISNLFKTGYRYKCPGFIIIYKKNSLDYDRFGVVVSRRLGNAVKRNKNKRIFREIFRTHKTDIPPFFDILIKPNIDSLSVKRESLISCFKEWQKKVKS